MVENVREIPHTEYIKQLARHLATVAPSRYADKSLRRTAEVAIVIRLASPSSQPILDPSLPAVPQISQWLDAQENQRAQVLFIQRAQYPDDPWSGHIGFPGGKREASDHRRGMAVERECREELDLDLGLPEDYVRLGELNDTCAYSLGQTLLMVIRPYVYLQICRETPLVRLNEEVASAHWVDLDQCLKALRGHSETKVPVDIVSKLLNPSGGWWHRMAQMLVGKVCYSVLPLEYTEDNAVRRGPGGSMFATDRELFLWGLSLGMVSELVDMSLPLEFFHQASGGYAAADGPWPQLSSVVWWDVNWLMNAIYPYVWSPRGRRPWRTNPRNSLLAYFRILPWTLSLSVVAKLWFIFKISRLRSLLH